HGEESLENHEHEHHDEENHDNHAEEESHDDDSHKEEGHDEHDHGSVDPHLWISPVLSQKLAESIKNSLVEADAEGAELYEANFDELVSEWYNWISLSLNYQTRLKTRHSSFHMLHLDTLRTHTV
ncbi:periplasmic solute binding protein, partial [Planococcus antarcticus DSM 14505]